MSESIWNDPRITSYVLDELSPEQRAEFERELQTNPQLATAVDDARRVTSQLGELYVNELNVDTPAPRLDDERRDAILAGEPSVLASEPSVLAGEPSVEISSAAGDRSSRLPLAIMAIAATLLLLLGIAPRLARQDAEIAMQQADQSESQSPLQSSRESSSGSASSGSVSTGSVSTGASLRSGVGADADAEQDVFGVSEEESLEAARGESAAGKDMTVAGGYSVPAEREVAESAESEDESAFDDVWVASQVPSDASESKSTAERSAMSRPFAAGQGLGRGDDPAVDGVVRDGRKMASSEIASSESVRRHVAPAPATSADRPFSDSSDLSGSLQSDGAVVLRGRKQDVERAKAMLGQQQSAMKSKSDAYAVAPGELDSVAIGDKQSSMTHDEPMTEAPGSQLKSAKGLVPSQSPGERFSLEEGLSKNVGEKNSLDFSAPSLTAEPRMAGLAPAMPSPAAPDSPGAAPAAGAAYGGRAAAATPSSGTVRTRLHEMQSQSKFIPPATNIAPAPLGFGANETTDFSSAHPDGTGPGKSGDQFEPITDNPFKRVSEHPLSTFSVDVDTASYSKTRDFLMRANQLPRPDAVRIEEMVNYFDYGYESPSEDSDHPFAARAVITGCPWNEQHRLARIAIKGKEMNAKERPRCNLVFLIDTSGSMNAHNKLPLVLQGMKMLADRLNKKDRVAIVVYAGSAGLVLDSTKVGKKGAVVKSALTRLSAGGSTNGGAGIALAYQTARDNFIPSGVNRVILCTDGDFNVGTTGTDELVRMVERESKGGVFLSVLGFGMGNHNDAMLEKISARGNGNYAFIDTENEARKVLVDQASATLVTIAKDVKLQVEFNPAKVSSYRLIGYENRILAKEDFNDDKKDAGEIGAGHEVTALYEIVPAGVDADASRPEVDPLRYQTKLQPTDTASSNETVTVKLRYKQPDGDKSTLIDFPVTDNEAVFADADVDTRFAAAVAGFGMQLRRSDYRGNWTISDVLSAAEGAVGNDEFGLRAEFVRIVRKASELMGQ
tara:strand:+ start:209542 stop:212574 length:3033 start_codon:yes stop_codon:yes gene_type:complete